MVCNCTGKVAMPSTSIESSSSETFRFAAGTRFCVYAGSALFSMGGIAALLQGSLAGLFLLAFAVIGIWACIETAGKATVTESGIEYKKPFFPPRKGRWQDIVSLEANESMSRLELKMHADGDIRLPTQLVGYIRILNAIRRHRKDLFAVRRITRFQRKRITAYAMLACGAMLLCFALFLPGEADDQWARMVLLGFALFGPCILLFQLIELVIEDPYLTLRYPFHEKRIPKREIRNIKLEQGAGRYGVRVCFIAIDKRDGERIKLNGFRQGDMEASEAMRTWLYG